jgi:hypothetical protein
MKIGLHANQLDHRGNSTVIYDYASALKNYFGYDVHIITSKPKSTHPMDKFSKFGYSMYENVSELECLVDKEKIDVLYMTKAGNIDKICPTNCKTAIHCVFDMREPHGSVYAGVSEWLAQYYKKELWVPHIIDIKKTNSTLHHELGIPKTAFIVGRLGGYEQFDLPFVHSAIKSALNARQDLYTVFLNTKPFIDHPRAKFIPFQPELEFKGNFISTCDAMIHGRSDGETFGLAVAEFSSMNKPILTYDAPYWWYMRSHLHILGEKAITYKNEEELLSYLLQIDKEYVRDIDWDCYSTRFSPANVIERFNTIFIK